MQRKHIAPLLISLFLFLAPGVAENYDLYKIPSYRQNTAEILLFPNGDTLYIEPGGKAIYWDRNDQNIAMMTNEDYSCLNAKVGILQLDDGHYGLLMKDDAAESNGNTIRIEYWIWSEQTIELIRVWENGVFYSAYCDNGFLIYERGKSTVLYDAYACELWRGNLCDEKEYRPYGLRMRSADDWVCALNDHSVDESYNACVRFINGNIAWHRRFEDYPSRIISILPLEDGWSIIAVSRNDGKYSPAKFFILDPKGNIISTHEIASDRKLLTKISLLLESEDETVFIYGSAVSNSKKTYLVWQLRFKVNSEFYSWNIRNCEYHNDYGPGLRAGGNAGINELPVFVKLEALDGSQAPTVFVPFEELPVITNQVLTLSLESAQGFRALTVNNRPVPDAEL